MRRHPSLFISVLVVGEIVQGGEQLRRRDPQAAGRLDRWVASLQQHYRARTYPVTTPVALELGGRMRALRPIPPIDGLMAATAVVHGLTLVTRNERHVAGLGVRTLNPYAG